MSVNEHINACFPVAKIVTGNQTMWTYGAALTTSGVARDDLLASVS